MPPTHPNSAATESPARARETREQQTGGRGITLADLHQANITRQAEWCAGGDPEPDLAFRGVELAGETGEALNVIKKLERERHGWRGSRATLADLGEELADVVICADLCAVTAGIDLSAAVVAKFNATSEKVGLTTKLAPAPSQDAAPALGEEVRKAFENAVTFLEHDAEWDAPGTDLYTWSKGLAEPLMAHLRSPAQVAPVDGGEAQIAKIAQLTIDAERALSTTPASARDGDLRVATSGPRRQAPAGATSADVNVAFRAWTETPQGSVHQGPAFGAGWDAAVAKLAPQAPAASAGREEAVLATHARRAFLRAADDRCSALTEAIQVMEIPKWYQNYTEKKERAEVRLKQSAEHYEGARSELLFDIERAALAPTAKPEPAGREGLKRVLCSFVQHTDRTRARHGGKGFDAIDWSRREEVIDAILDARPVAEGVAGWRPIETAPPGCGVVWLFQPHEMGGFMFAGARRTDGLGWGNNLDGARQMPTHWMPLPKSPATAPATPSEGGQG